eukprot:gene8243-10131_t
MDRDRDRNLENNENQEDSEFHDNEEDEDVEIEHYHDEEMFLQGNIDLKEMIKSNQTVNVCGLVFNSGDWGYYCDNCCLDSTSIFCAQCFKDGDHIGHKFQMLRTSGNGCCDCGDGDSVKESSFCFKHKDRYESDETLFNILPLKIQEQMKDWLFSLTFDRSFKTEFSICFGYCYPKIANNYIKDIHPYESSLLSITIQIFTIPSIVSVLINQHKLLDSVFQAIHFFIYSYSLTNNQRLEFKSKIEFTNETRALYSKFTYVISDLQLILASKDVLLELLNRDYQSILHWFKLLALFHFSNPNIRSTNEYKENITWVHYFTDTLLLSRLNKTILSNLILPQNPTPSEIQYYENAIKNLFLAIQIALESIDSTTTNDSGVEGGTSFHLPIHRTFSLLSLIITQNYRSPIESYAPTIWNNLVLSKQLLYGPASIDNVISESNSRMWLRNGTPIAMQILNYSSQPHLRPFFIDSDLFLKQASSSDPDDDSGGGTKQNNDFDQALSQVATFIPPTNLTDKGRYQLKPEFYSHYNRYYFRYTSLEKEKSAEIVNAKLQNPLKSSTSSVKKIPKLSPLKSQFKEIDSIFTSSTFYMIIFYSLYNSLVSDLPDEKPLDQQDTQQRKMEKSDIIDHVLHLIHLAFDSIDSMDGRIKVKEYLFNDTYTNQQLTIVDLLIQLKSSDDTKHTDFIDSVNSILNQIEIIESSSTSPKITGSSSPSLSTSTSSTTRKNLLTISSEDQNKEEKELKKQKMEIARQKIMQQFKSQQQQFSSLLNQDENMEDQEEEEEEDSLFKATCILCREETIPTDKDNPMGSLCLMVKSKLFNTMSLRENPNFIPPQFRYNNNNNNNNNNSTENSANTPSKFELIQLPYNYDQLLQLQIKCIHCQRIPNKHEQAICLYCGRMVCMASSCCKINQIGEVSRHSKSCGGEIGIYLIVDQSILIVVFDGIFSVVNSPYLDQHSEEDIGLRRGVPLFLVKERYQLLSNILARHELPSSKGNIQLDQLARNVI